MMVIINYLVIVVLIAAIVFAVKSRIQTVMVNNYSNSEMAEEEDTGVSMQDFENKMVDSFSRYLRLNLKAENMTAAQYKEEEKKHSRFTESINNAGYCDPDAKRIVMQHICNLLRSARMNYSNEDINMMIPFNNSAKLKVYDKWQILAYSYKQKYKSAWLSELIKEYNLDQGIDRYNDGRHWYWVSTERLNEVYDDFVGKRCVKGKNEDNKANLTFSDKINIVAQRAFEEKYGLGIADLLLEANVDEIDAGVSGNGYDSLYVMYHGRQIKFDFLTFGTEEELARVVDNIYKYDAPYVMSKTDAKIVGKMKNGNRITASRPPFSESYAFWCRMFDSSPGGRLKQLLVTQNKREDGTAEPVKNAFIVMEYLQWMNKGHQTGGVTGSTGCGKTTFLKTLIDFIDPTYSIGVAELQFEANLRKTYKDRNLITCQQTDFISMQEMLDFLKKCNRQVNIIGEDAEAIQSYFVVQTTGIASFYTMFTSHHDTTKKLVDGFGSDIVRIGQAASMAEAISMAASSLNWDCHVVNDKGYRHVDRITEIIPVERDESYPSTKLPDNEQSSELATRMDEMEYYHRSTNPDLYNMRENIIFENDCFYLINPPSEAMMRRIARVLTDEQMNKFRADIAKWVDASKDYGKKGQVA